MSTLRTRSSEHQLPPQVGFKRNCRTLQRVPARVHMGSHSFKNSRSWAFKFHTRHASLNKSWSEALGVQLTRPCRKVGMPEMHSRYIQHVDIRDDPKIENIYLRITDTTKVLHLLTRYKTWKPYLRYPSKSLGIKLTIQKIRHTSSLGVNIVSRDFPSRRRTSHLSLSAVFEAAPFRSFLAAACDYQKLQSVERNWPRHRDELSLVPTEH